MKVCFLTHSLDTPSVKWRVTQFLPALGEEGIECTVLPLPRGYLDLWRICGSAADFDAVVLQKRLLPTVFLRRLRKKARRLIYEFDDAVTVKRSPSGAIVPSSLRQRRFRYIVSHADAVVTTNAYLAGICRDHRADNEIHILPNAIDASRWTTKSHYAAVSPIILGWQGTASNLPYLRLIEEPLRRLNSSGTPVTLKVVCDKPVELPSIPVLHQPYDAGREIEDILSFDIGVAPLPDDDWTRGKQPVKILCYLAAGLPVIASRAGAHAGLVNDGDNGLLAGSPEEWTTHLMKLISSEPLRQSLGLRARRSAETTFSSRTAGRAYAAIIRHTAG